ncbi:DsbA family protein [Planobispora takensis]|uniref:DsbA family protein n=1 Tax=Planobispora takensis TaxID=1367882 RepID=UPI001EF3044C|nr:DsbA family protein [Planobispora takensis]
MADTVADTAASSTAGAGTADAGAAVIEVVEYTDPGCVWAWGSEPKLRRLRLALERAGLERAGLERAGLEHAGDLERADGPERSGQERGGGVRWRRVFGVQLDGPAGGRGDAAAVLAGWHDVARHTGAPVPDVLAYAHTTTRPACTAAAAAELQGDDVAGRVLRRLRESFFVHGRPADDPRAVADALRGTPGLDLDRLLADLDSPQVRARLERDWEETRDPLPEVVGLIGEGPAPGAARPDGDRLRYGFPTVVLRGPGGHAVVPGWRRAAEYRAAVERVLPGGWAEPAPLTGEDAGVAQAAGAAGAAS